MSLATMANGIRAERAANAAAAPAARERNRLAAGRQWKESKRRAWEKARPAFEGAFQRQFTPERFFYTSGERNRNQFVKVAINYEGKLLAWVNVYNGERPRPILHVRPIDAPEDDEKMIQCAPEAMYGELAKLVEKWGLACGRPEHARARNGDYTPKTNCTPFGASGKHRWPATTTWPRRSRPETTSLGSPSRWDSAARNGSPRR